MQPCERSNEPDMVAILTALTATYIIAMLKRYRIRFRNGLKSTSSMNAIGSTNNAQPNIPEFPIAVRPFTTSRLIWVFA